SNYTLNNSAVSGTGIGEFGAGTLTRTGTSPYSLTGGLTGNGGTVTFGTGDTVGGSGSVNNSGTITVGPGTLVSSLPGTLSMTTNNSPGATLIYAGVDLSAFSGVGVNVTGGTLTFSTGTILPTLGAVNVNPNNWHATVNFSTGSPDTVASLAVWGGLGING